MQKTDHLTILDQMVNWFETNNFKGYDPYDIRCLNNITRSLYHNHWNLGVFGKLFAYGVFEIFDWYFPLLLRKLLFIKKKKHITSLAHLAIAYLAQDYQNKNQLTKKKYYQIIDSLKQLSNIHNGLPTWGLPFTWGTGNRKFKPDTALTVVMVWVGDSFLEGYKLYGDTELLSYAIDIKNSIIKNCGYNEFDDQTICFNYSNRSNDQIHNANLLAASFIFETAQIQGNNHDTTLAKKALQHSLSYIKPDGSLPYGNVSGKIKSKNDLYHCSYETRSLFKLAKLKKDKQLDKIAWKYWNYIEATYLDYKDKKYSKYPIKDRYLSDTTALGELLHILPHLSSSKNYQSLNELIDYNLKRQSNKKYEFIYQEKLGWTNKATYIRWSQGWIIAGIGYNLLTKNNKV